MARPEKETTVRDLKEKFGRAKAVVLSDYRGLTVAQITELRKRLRDANLEYRVAKNTLTRLAASELLGEELDPYLVGPTALAFSYDDPVAAAKVLTEFAKTYKVLTIKGAVLEDKVINADAVKDLAELPSYDVLAARLLGVLLGPIRGLASVLSGPQRNLVYALNAIREEKEKAAG